MKKFIILSALALVLCGNSNAQQVQRANVYFKNNSAELNPTLTSLLDTIYNKLPEGKKIRIGLVGDGEDFSMTRYSDERFAAVQNYFVSKNVKPEFVRYEKTASDGEAVIEKEVKFAAKKFADIDDYFRKNIQSFSINPSKDITIKGEKGTEITFPAYAFQCADGSTPGGAIRVELREFYGKGDLLKADLHTMAGSNILETGGTVHIAAFCGNEEATLAEGAQITLSFPYREFKDGMKAFNGIVNDDNLDWVEGAEANINQGMEINQYYNEDVEYGEYSVMDGAYMKNQQGVDTYLLSSGSLGWINCDRFYDDPREKMEVVLNVDTALHPAVRLVFKDIQAVMSSYDEGGGTYRFSGIPKGSEISIVAYSIVDNKPYMAIKNINVESNSAEKLALAETTKLWMERELLSLK